MTKPELSEWLKKPASQNLIKNNLSSSKSLTKDEYEIVGYPFKVLRLKNVLSDDEGYVEELMKEVSILSYERKLNDLYSLWQTDDLQNIDAPLVNSFVHFLKESIRPLLSRVTGIELNDKLSATASCYFSGDHLLCHDDKCEDRCVAFVFYLNDFGDFEGGGEFEMFAHGENGQPTEIVSSLCPMRNSLICFEVGNYSYHQVSEVKGDDLKRYSINGWFHSEKALETKALDYKEALPPLTAQESIHGLFLLDEYIHPKYCTPSTIQDFREHVAQESFLMLSNFLCPRFYKKCFRSLKEDDIRWNMVGPPNRRRYEVAEMESVGEEGGALLSLMRSPLFVHYLRNMSGLQLAPLTSSHPGSPMTLELQRWKHGFYTMVTDNDEFFHKPGLDIYIFLLSETACWGTPDGSGFITYLSSSHDDEEAELLTVEPTENTFCLVYRAEDTVMFTKYISEFFSGCYFCVRATYYEAEEDT